MLILTGELMGDYYIPGQSEEYKRKQAAEREATEIKSLGVINRWQ